MISFSEPIDEITATQGVSLTLNGAPVAGSITFQNFGQFLVFNQAAPLLPGVYTVTTTQGLTDVAGNPISNTVSFSFTVSTAADTVAPTVSSYNPPNGATGIGLNVALQVVFSEPINPLSVTATTVSITNRSNNLTIPASLVVNPARTLLTITPTQPYLTNTDYCWYLNGILDLAGNSGGYSYTCFTTATANDTAAPTVSAVNPPNGAVQVPLNAVLVAQFTKPIDAVSFALNTSTAFMLSNGGTAVAGTPTLSSDGLTLSFAPAATLVANTSYTIKLANLTDYVGNALAAFSSSFSTGTVADQTQPFVITESPASGATGVAVNSYIVITFSKLLNPLTVNSSTITVAEQSGSVQFSGAYSLNNSGSGGIVTFTPSAPLLGGTQIYVSVNGVQDFAGNNNQYSYWVFTTAGTSDTTPPTITSVTPTSGSTNLGLNTIVTLTFSKPLNPTTISSTTFALFNGTSPLGTSVSHSADYQSVTLSTSLPNNATITVVATHGVQDLSGNALADFQSTFTTVQASNGSSPSVVSQRPANSGTQIPASASISLFISEPLQPSTAIAAMDVSQNGVLVAGTTQLVGNGQEVLFTPSAPLIPGALVQVFLSSSALDLFGNPLYNYQGQFTVAPDLTGVAPVISSTTPGNSYGAVTSANPAIQIAFSKPIDPTTVNSSTVSLNFQQNGQIVATTISLVAPNIINVLPVSPLLPTYNYYYQVSSGIKDTNGVSFANTSTFYFETGAATDTAQPRVTSITPPPSSSNIGTNAPVELHFSKPIDPLLVSSSAVQITANGTPVTPVSINFVGSTNQDIQFIPIGALPANTVINVAVSALLTSPAIR